MVIVIDGHVAVPADTGQFMGDPILIYKAHLDGYVRIFLIVEPVKATLSKKGEARHSKRDGVRNTGFSPAISPGDDGRIAEGQFRRFFIGLEAGNTHTGDLKLFDLFQLSAPSFGSGQLFYAACWPC